MKNSFLLVSIASAACLMIVSCATGSYIRTGKTLAPSSAAAVKVLAKYPKKYETIGLVEASTEEPLFGSDAQIGVRVLNELRAQAAKLGANAVVIKNYGGDSSGDLILGSNDDLGFITNSERKRVSGEAILTR